MTKRKRMAFDRRFGKMIAYHRRRAGVSQQQMGKHLGLSSQQISKYERGLNRIGVYHAWQISKALQFDLFEVISEILD